MPITKELENLRKFESVGFTHEQADTLADVIEQSHVNGQQSFKEFMGSQFKDLRTELDNKFRDIRNEIKDVRNEIVSSELRIKASHTDLLIKILAITAGCTSIGVAISKVWK